MRGHGAESMERGAERMEQIAWSREHGAKSQGQYSVIIEINS